MNLKQQYDTSLERVERIFEVPDLLKDLFIEAMDAAIEEVKLHSTRHKLGNQRKVLGNIQHETMVKAKEKYISVLYEDTVIFIVSLAEQILKDCFNGLIANNLQKLDLDDEFRVTFADLKANDFQTDRDYWARRIIEEIHGARSPQEKANFQNILAIENLFAKYFKINIDNEEYRKAANRVHYFFQVRHILLHNAGIIDERFVKNVKAVGIGVNREELGKRIDMTKSRYDNCKYVFGALFIHLDRAIKDSGLILDKTAGDNYVTS